MQFVEYPPSNTWPALCQRPDNEQETIYERVRQIIAQVRLEGDAALRTLAKTLDGVSLDTLIVPNDQPVSLPETLQQAIQLAHDNLKRFHEAQRETIKRIETQPGVTCWRKSVPIEKVGLYIPGGSAPLFSTLLMLGVPARLAGCREIIVCTPPSPSGIHPAIRYTAQLLDIRQVYAVGGAQAIAAMAFGTDEIPKVDKIFGPGNQYVTYAKQQVQTEGVAIDMPAGPSEVLVIADDRSRADFVAADLLSQAEHGPDSQVVLVSPSKALINAVEKELAHQLAQLPRREVAAKALANSRAILVRDLPEALALSNAYAPEHLIIALDEAEKWGEAVTQAGSVFLGHWSCESAGDYASGTNHTLPTNGYARAYSGVSLDSFLRKITFQELSPEGIRNIGPAVARMAEAEELAAHQMAMLLRLQSLEKH